MATIRCMYSCDACGTRRQPVDVPERGPAEDIVGWTASAVAAIQADHLWRSNGCQSKRLAEVMIPVPKGTLRVGEIVRS